MLRIWAVNLRCLSRSPAAIVSVRAFSSSEAATASDDKVYELRTYDVKPDRFADFLKLTAENIHVRTAFSKLLGYWTTELGGINQVVHMWEYDDYEHRSNVRKALSQDPKWLNSYIFKMIPMLEKQDNVVLHRLPWCPINEPQDNGVYELRKYTLQPGKLPEWSAIFPPGLQARTKYSSPVAVWRTEFGPLETLFSLWQYKSLDERTDIRNQASKDPVWTNTLKEHSSMLVNYSNKALVPTIWSPWK